MNTPAIFYAVALFGVMAYTLYTFLRWEPEADEARDHFVECCQATEAIVDHRIADEALREIIRQHDAGESDFVPPANPRMSTRCAF